MSEGFDFARICNMHGLKQSVCMMQDPFSVGLTYVRPSTQVDLPDFSKYLLFAAHNDLHGHTASLSLTEYSTWNYKLGQSLSISLRYAHPIHCDSDNRICCRTGSNFTALESYQELLQPMGSPV